MSARLPWFGLLASAALAVTGCYEESTPAYYEPGEYKGESDPLVEKLEQGDAHQQLEHRFDRAARDR